jgi:peptide chain release factor subunit 1
MYHERELRELLSLTAPQAVLSVYLNMDPSKGSSEAYRLRLRTLLKEVQLTQDVQAVELFINRQYDGTGQGLAIFSCAEHDFFKVFPLAIPVHDAVYVGDRPNVRPLADLLDDYGGYGVVLIDQQGARLFHFHLGELQEQNGMMGKEIKHAKGGEDSAFRGGQTHAHEEMVDRNMKEAAEFADDFFEQKRIRRILIGGSDHNVALFQSQLPKSWQSLVVGTFSISMNASHTEVLSRAFEVGQKAEQKRESHLVDSLITSAAKGSGAVVGLGDTLAAVNNAQVKTLVLLPAYQVPGYRCTGCGFLVTKSKGSCAGCGGAVETVPDLVSMAVGSVLSHGGDIETIRESEPFRQAGEIGAFLRY